MPSPFPGMDPYLETSQYWLGFHGCLIAGITGALNAGLPKGLAADSEVREYIMPPRNYIVPEVYLSQPISMAGPTWSGGTAILDNTNVHGELVALPEQEHEMFIEIRSAGDWDHVVTIIEVLSPTNKAFNTVGRREYLNKQASILDSDTNLVEIDLLRGGIHTAAAPYDELRRRGDWDHLICVHRSVKLHHFEYWFNHFPSPLPEINIPLTNDLPDFQLDLQAAFDQAYDTGPYFRRVDYCQEPPIPLDEATAAWADAILKEKGRR